MKPKRTILCVDDNEQSLSIRKVMLETRGYRVMAATSAKDALEVFKKLSEIEPTTGDNFLRMAELYRRVNKFDQETTRGVKAPSLQASKMGQSRSSLATSSLLRLALICWSRGHGSVS